MNPITLKEIQNARDRIAPFVLRTPLLKLAIQAQAQIYLKLENLQPIGSFKLRGAGNAILQAPSDALRNGVWTASAGNMAQGVAWNAQRLGLRCSVVVPDHAPESKLNAIARYGADILKIPFGDWWKVMLTNQFEGMNGYFIHPVCNRDVIAGNGTIGLEILEDLPDVDSVFIPYGGGGLSCGIASAIKALKPDTNFFACEVETAAPLAASLAAGEPAEVEYTPSFVDGIGGKSLLPEMWPLVRDLLAASHVMDLHDVKRAIRLLTERNHIIAEGAGATPVAAALKHGAGKVVCVVSGGNINSQILADILQDPRLLPI